jgi:hypothetical protein
MGCAVVPKTNFVFFLPKKGDTALTTGYKRSPLTMHMSKIRAKNV